MHLGGKEIRVDAIRCGDIPIADPVAPRSFHVCPADRMEEGSAVEVGALEQQAEQAFSKSVPLLSLDGQPTVQRDAIGNAMFCHLASQSDGLGEMHEMEMDDRRLPIDEIGDEFRRQIERRSVPDDIAQTTILERQREPADRVRPDFASRHRERRLVADREDRDIVSELGLSPTQVIDGLVDPVRTVGIAATPEEMSDPDDRSSAHVRPHAHLMTWGSRTPSRNGAGRSPRAMHRRLRSGSSHDGERGGENSSVDSSTGSG